MNEKSPMAAFALAFVLGPIGLIYASPAWGLALIAMAIITAPTVLGPVAIMIASMVAAPLLAQSHNERVRRQWAALAGGRATMDAGKPMPIKD